MSIATQVRLVEVSPRDGLQNEAGAMIATEVKLELIERLGEAGLSYIEAASFVSPKWVPQMADASAVMQGIKRRPNVVYAALTPNMQGFEHAVHAQVQEVAVFASASETFSQKNINCSISESLARFAPIIEQAKKHNIRVRGYISTVLGCPYEGAINPSQVATLSQEMLAMGCYEISLGDTIGVGTPLAASRLIEAVAKVAPVSKLAAHFHDTYGQALANLYAVLQQGVQVVDASVAGLGGCPYARGAAGNVASEDVVYMLHGMGIETGISLDKIVQTGHWISQQLGRVNQSKVAQTFMDKT